MQPTITNSFPIKNKEFEIVFFLEIIQAIQDISLYSLQYLEFIYMALIIFLMNTTIYLLYIASFV